MKIKLELNEKKGSKKQKIRVEKVGREDSKKKDVLIARNMAITRGNKQLSNKNHHQLQSQKTREAGHNKKMLTLQKQELKGLRNKIVVLLSLLKLQLQMFQCHKLQLC